MAIEINGRTIETDDNGTLVNSQDWDKDVAQALGGLPRKKRHCSLLGLQALQQAIGDYLLKRLLFRDGIIKTEEEYEQLKAKHPILFRAHSCDGSCEEKEP